MEILRRLRNWPGPPLALQIMILLLGGLVVSQLVTLFLTLVLPPEPQQQYDLRDIAQVLLDKKQGGHAGMQRLIQPGAPSPSGPRWLTSDRSRQDLAKMIGTDARYVRLFFYTPLPFAGTALPPQRIAEAEETLSADSEMPREPRMTGGFVRTGFDVAQAAGTPSYPGGGFPGGFPGSGFPGGRFPGGAVPATGLPSAPVDVIAPSISSVPTPVQIMPAPVTTVAPTRVVPMLVEPGGVGGALSGVVARPGAAVPFIAPMAPMAARPPMQPLLAVPSIPLPTANLGMPKLPPPQIAEAPKVKPRQASSIFKTAPAITATPPSVPHLVMKPLPPVVTASAPQPVMRPTQSSAPPEPILPVPRGLFGLAPAPFVQGDFVAALQLGSGAWAVVQPTPEPFPNSWQRRVLLWFIISFTIVAPFGWLFARRLVHPISGFALAAERLGRDPTAQVLAVEGPAEVGRAAHAFNRMQDRLRSFVDDRTAMVGAISHDLRTPLTRLRFRIEDVPDEMREPMLAEVDEMEQMISSVLAFIRDASEPGSRERLDLRTILEDVVEDAHFIGKDVTLAESERAPVDVDPLGIRRLLGNLVENAVKYGERAQVRLFTDRQEVVAEVSDEGPGLPEEELERVFQPFYRAPAARVSNKHGTGLGLAVCRSIARAHGGDVQLRRGSRGLVAQLRLPLAYGMADS